MTDKEIVKALECCSQDNIDCEECPANGICDNDDFCFTGAILDLINRQKAEKQAMLDHIKVLQYENEKLKADADMADGYADALIERTRTEAIKEFAERLKNQTAYYWLDEINIGDIDNLVKEMTEQRRDDER